MVRGGRNPFELRTLMEWTAIHRGVQLRVVVVQLLLSCIEMQSLSVWFTTVEPRTYVLSDRPTKPMHGRCVRGTGACWEGLASQTTRCVVHMESISSHLIA